MKNLLLKLAVLLALTDNLAKSYKLMITDYIRFFKGSQSAFIGGKKTYSPKEGTIDEPTKRGVVKIQTTVWKKLNWFTDNSAKYIDALFSQEATNAANIAKAELIVEGKSWGILSSLELLRLKSIVIDQSLETMISNIPVRSDAEEWTITTNEMYKNNHNVFETPLVTGVNITTTKEDYILKDPNINEAKGANYVPQVAQKTTVVELGEYTTQKFSGQWSHRERANTLRRRQALLSAITVALKQCNDVESIKSDLTADRIFGYMFFDK